MILLGFSCSQALNRANYNFLDIRVFVCNPYGNQLYLSEMVEKKGCRVKASILKELEIVQVSNYKSCWKYMYL